MGGCGRKEKGQKVQKAQKAVHEPRREVACTPASRRWQRAKAAVGLELAQREEAAVWGAQAAAAPRGGPMARRDVAAWTEEMPAGRAQSGATRKVALQLQYVP